MELMEQSGWYGVRCVFAWQQQKPWRAAQIEGEVTYEERITIWRADSADEAIAKAEFEASEYAKDIDAEYLGLAQSYAMADELQAGAEVFSLLRDSPLATEDYRATHFDTGDEYQSDGPAEG